MRSSVKTRNASGARGSAGSREDHGSVDAVVTDVHTGSSLAGLRDLVVRGTACWPLATVAARRDPGRATQQSAPKPSIAIATLAASSAQ